MQAKRIERIKRGECGRKLTTKFFPDTVARKMNKKAELKILLANAASQKGKYVSDLQVDRAAEELSKKTSIALHNIRELGESIANDKEAFTVVDIDDVNDVLKKKE